MVIDNSMEVRSPGGGGPGYSLGDMRKNLNIHSIEKSERVLDPADVDKLIIKAAPMSGIDEAYEADERETDKNRDSG